MSMDFPEDPIKKLIAIMAHLRSPAGCPWDQRQSPESLRPYLLEETYEVLAALDEGDPDEIMKELGDLLLQIVFLADIFKEKGLFDFDSIADSISGKLIRRHPHVFSDSKENNLLQLDRQWESIKNAERKCAVNSILEPQPSNLPALLLAQKISTKVARVGFDWTHYQEVLLQLDDELAELDEAVQIGDKTAISNEIGDILFTIVNMGRHLDIDCETALFTMTDRFSFRFRKMEDLISQDNKQIDQLGITELNLYWQKAKKIEHDNR